MRVQRRCSPESHWGREGTSAPEESYPPLPDQYPESPCAHSSPTHATDDHICLK